MLDSMKEPAGNFLLYALNFESAREKFSSE